MKANEFVKQQLDILLEELIGKTLGEIDKKGLFETKGKYKKVTGIAGDVIEQSYLGLPANSKQEPDLIVDGIPIELKTTGIRYSKKIKGLFEGKEPMSITAVSPEKIIYEEFNQSKLWEKLSHTLIVFYHYDAENPVNASEYSDFIIKGYLFHEFKESEKEQIKADWEKVRDYIRDLHSIYEKPQEYYSSISSALRKDLMYLDTAPKWPNNPRFRLKRGVITSIVQDYLQYPKYEHFNGVLKSFDEIDILCNDLSEKYAGKSIKELMTKFDISGTVTKEIGERIAVAMLGGKSKRISNLDFFNKANIIGKTITLTKKGKRTEDTKFITINFEEWTNEVITFEESEIYDYFANNQFLMIIFEKPSKEAELMENTFVKFKRIVFPEDFIFNEVQKTWDKVRQLIRSNELEENIVYSKKTKKPIINKVGTYRTRLNFPKSREYNVFLRGTGGNSELKHKPVTVNGIRMYNQYVWIKGKLMTQILKIHD